MHAFIRVALAASFSLFSVSTLAQQSAAPLVVGQAAQRSNILRTGTAVQLRTRTELNSRSSRVGERFDLEVSEPVTLEGQTVIPAGSIATGEVTRVRNRGMWGRRGILETRLLYVRVGDRQLRLTGAAGDQGRPGTVGVVAAVVLIPVVGFFVTGTSAVLPPGTQTIAYLDEDVPVVFSQPVAVQPLVVPTVAPAPVAAATATATPVPTPPVATPR